MRPRSAVVILSILVVAVFGPTLLGGFVWDDEVLITRNAKLQGEDAWRRALVTDFWDTSIPTDARQGYWRPVVKLWHLALLRVGGGVAWPFHLANVLVHLACVLLVFRWLLARSERNGTDDLDARPALLGAALFAVHPSRYEVVGWASCLTDLLMAAFALLALWALERRRYVVAAGLVSLSLLSKESVVVLPALIALDGLWRRRLDPRAVGASVAGLSGPILARAALGLASPPMVWGDLGATLQRSAAALGVYFWRTIWPVPATVLPWEPPGAEAPAHWGIVFPALGIAIGLSTVLLLGWARRQSSAKPWLADGVWWLVGLAPFLQVLSLPSATFASDRFLYLPLLGLCALVARAISASSRPPPRLMAAAAVGAGALTLALALPAYESPLRFFEREYRLHPESTFIASAYAGQLQREGLHVARRELVRRLALQTRDRRVASWALGHLANATLALHPDAQSLDALAEFYEGLTNGTPVSLKLNGEVLPLPDKPQMLVHQARNGMLDDIELFAATVALERGRLDEALEKASPLTRAPTVRRLTLLIRVLAARGDFSTAAQVIEQSPFASLRQSSLAAAVRLALQLPKEPLPPCHSKTPCDASALELRAQWVEVWHELQIAKREDAALDALGDAPLAMGLRFRALLRREDEAALEALLLEAPHAAQGAEVRRALTEQRRRKAEEVALIKEGWPGAVLPHR